MKYLILLSTLMLATVSNASEKEERLDILVNSGSMGVIFLDGFFPAQFSWGLSLVNPKNSYVVTGQFGMGFLDIPETGGEEGGYHYDGNVDRCRAPNGEFAKDYMCGGEDEVGFTYALDVNRLIFTDKSSKWGMVGGGLMLNSLDDRMIPYASAAMMWHDLLELPVYCGVQSKVSYNVLEIMFTFGLSVMPPKPRDYQLTY